MTNHITCKVHCLIISAKKCERCKVIDKKGKLEFLRTTSLIMKTVMTKDAPVLENNIYILEKYPRKVHRN